MGRTRTRALTPMDMFGDQKIGMSLARVSSSASCAAERPVVPMTMGLPVLAALRAELRLTSGAVKSMTVAPGQEGNSSCRSCATGQPSTSSPLLYSARSTTPLTEN